MYISTSWRGKSLTKFIILRAIVVDKHTNETQLVYTIIVL